MIPCRLTGTTQKPIFTPKWKEVVEKAIETGVEKQLEKVLDKEEAGSVKGIIKDIEELFIKKIKPKRR